jgi:hypothetical protein
MRVITSVKRRSATRRRTPQTVGWSDTTSEIVEEYRTPVRRRWHPHRCSRRGDASIVDELDERASGAALHLAPSSEWCVHGGVTTIWRTLPLALWAASTSTDETWPVAEAMFRDDLNHGLRRRQQLAVFRDTDERAHCTRTAT